MLFVYELLHWFFQAILSRKLIVPEMHDVMHKIEQLSVTGDFNHVRRQSREVRSDSSVLLTSLLCKMQALFILQHHDHI